MLTRISAYATPLLGMLVLATSVAAQQRASLDEAERLLKAGQLAEARATLTRWQNEHKAATTATEDGARATYLSARLALDGAVAADAYLAVAISAPAASPYVPESLLRVGQAELMNGAPRNAVPYLKRLVDLYPRSEFAAAGAEWLKRALAADTATRRVQTGQAPVERNQTSMPASTSGGFAIQVAAFHEPSGARAVLRALQNGGFGDARIVTVPDNGLLRVRVGRFGSAAAAAPTVKRLRSAGYNVVVVSDAARESKPRD